jgi:hypothetical protein
VKNFPADRLNLAETIAMYENFGGRSTSFFQNIEQFPRRTAIEIAHEFQVQTFAVLMFGDSKI